VNLTRDWVAAHDRREAAITEQRAELRARDLERLNAEAEAACHGYDTTELAAQHEREKAADLAAEQRAEAEEAQASERDVREAWEATREIADDDADGPAMEARVNAFFDDVQRREIARWTRQHPDPEPPEFDEAETELETPDYDDVEAEL
jgi:hypothetical protein